MRASSAFFFAGEAFYLQGLFAQSKRSYEESLSLCDAAFNLRENGHRLGRLGQVACGQGDLAQARTLCAKGLMVASQCHDLVGSGMALIGLARVAALCGDYRRAVVLTAAKEEMTTINPIVRYWPMDRIENERTLAILQPHVTVLPERSTLNLNTASAEALSASVAGLDLALAQQVVASRGAAPFVELAAAFSRIPGATEQTVTPQSHDVRSRFFEVRARLRLDDVVIEERSVIQRSGLSTQVLWRERVPAS